MKGTNRPGRILLQMAAIIGIGFAVGIVDAFVVRPVDLSKRQAPEKDLDVLLSGAKGGSANVKVRPPEPADTGKPGDTPRPPTHTPPDMPEPNQGTPPAGHGTAVAAPSGGTAPFVPTKKADLPEGQITLEAAKQAFDAGAMFVDARKPEDYAAGHVENAIRIESEMFRHGDPPELGLIPRSAIVVVYCNGGHCDESENVAKYLSNSGYGKVFVMHDGFPGWKAVGYPFATGE